MWSSVDIRRANGSGGFVRKVDGGSEGQVLGGLSHRRDHEERVVRRHLHRFTNRGVRAAAIDVVDAHHVGQEETVELASLEQATRARPNGRSCL